MRATIISLALALSGISQGHAKALIQVQGTIRGTVSDSAGAVVPAAEVTVKGQRTGISRHTRTNDVGQFEVRGLPPGIYDIEVEVQGFKKVTRPAITLSPTQSLHLNITIGEVPESSRRKPADAQEGAKRKQKAPEQGPVDQKTTKLADEPTPSTFDPVSGSYEGVARGKTIDIPLRIEIKNNNGKLSGAIHMAHDQVPITNGTYAFGRINLKCDVGGNELTVTAQLEDRKVVGTWTLSGESGTLDLTKRSSRIGKTIEAVEWAPKDDLKLRSWLNRQANEGKLLHRIIPLPAKYASLFLFEAGPHTPRNHNYQVYNIPSPMTADEIISRVNQDPSLAFIGVHHVKNNLYLMVFYGTSQ